MIVKDEATNIRATLESVRGVVDRWTIFDTGSGDSTQTIVREVMGDIPGALHEGRFVDFATNRNFAAWLDTNSDDAAAFALSLSGDETIEGGEALRAFLESKRSTAEGAYCVEMRSGPQRWFYPRILRVGAGWRYVGEVHEVPIGPNGETSGPVIPDVRIVHTESDPSRKQRRLREFDVPTLERIIADIDRPIGELAQALFHLAETEAQLAATCRDNPTHEMLSHQMAAMALFKRYAALAGNRRSPCHDPAKAHYALFLYLHVAEKTGVYTVDELAQRYRSLAAEAPEIPEVTYKLAEYAAGNDTHVGLDVALIAASRAARALSKPGHVPTDARLEWLSLRLAAECALAIGDKPRAQEFAKRGIAAGGPTEAFAEYIGALET